MALVSSYINFIIADGVGGGGGGGEGGGGYLTVYEFISYYG